MTEDRGDKLDIPKNLVNKRIIYDEKYKWMMYKPNQTKPLSSDPCPDCNRIFYGNNGETTLKLHKIIVHMRDVS